MQTGGKGSATVPGSAALKVNYKEEMKTLK